VRRHCQVNNSGRKALASVQIKRTLPLAGTICSESKASRLAIGSLLEDIFLNTIKRIRKGHGGGVQY
jgi:hypothetical protein